MARVRQRARCAASCTDGTPCDAYAITGGRVCSAHGGRAPQVVVAAKLRLLEDSVDRQIEQAHRSHRERLIDWWAARVTWVADQIGEDPVQLAQEAAGRRWWVSLSRPLDTEWPPGLRDADEPVLRFDRRYGPRTGR